MWATEEWSTESQLLLSKRSVVPWALIEEINKDLTIGGSNGRWRVWLWDSCVKAEEMRDHAQQLVTGSKGGTGGGFQILAGVTRLMTAPLTKVRDVGSWTGWEEGQWLQYQLYWMWGCCEALKWSCRHAVYGTHTVLCTTLRTAFPNGYNVNGASWRYVGWWPSLRHHQHNGKHSQRGIGSAHLQKRVWGRVLILGSIHPNYMQYL